MSLYTALSPRSWILSSLRVSLALQKCQTRWQYVKYGKIADLKSTNFAVVGIRFLNLIITPTLWLALLHTSLMCSFNSGLNVITEPVSPQSVYPLPDPVLFLRRYSDVSLMTDYRVNIRSLTQISMSTKSEHRKEYRKLFRMIYTGVFLNCQFKFNFIFFRPTNHFNHKWKYIILFRGEV